MSYTVIARRWRPQKLDEVVGQRAVTQTLRNAIASGRIAQAFVFAGPRGVGKTTTARILARMLNCEKGPTPDPCGACDPCREIAEGRDMDVLELDAATHTGIDNIRDVIISGLAILPARDRYKVFVIDEVHQLSSSSFNALLKSIEEPPPHVAFIMATTAPDKIPDTIVSRAQVFEFKTISSRLIGEQLSKIAKADGIDASPEAVALIARSAEGSMRDAETAFDQVIAFAGNTVAVEDVATVLGLVGRDLLFDVMTAVADENGPAAFDLAGRAVEAGYELRLLCRELSRLVRDVLVLSVDPSRFSDPDVAPEADHERLRTLAGRFSREDLLRSFDVLTRAESEVRAAAEPRYNFEMALLRWIHLRQLTPLADLDRPPGERRAAFRRIGPAFLGRPSAGAAARAAVVRLRRPQARVGAGPFGTGPSAGAAAGPDRPGARETGSPSSRQMAPTRARRPRPGRPATASRTRSSRPSRRSARWSTAPWWRRPSASTWRATGSSSGSGPSRRCWATRWRSRRPGSRNWPPSSRAAGSRWWPTWRRVSPGPRRAAAAMRTAGPAEAARDLKAEAMKDPVLQSLLDVIPAEVKDVTELK